MKWPLCVWSALYYEGALATTKVAEMVTTMANTTKTSFQNIISCFCNTLAIIPIWKMLAERKKIAVVRSCNRKDPRFGYFTLMLCRRRQVDVPKCKKPYKAKVFLFFCSSFFFFLIKPLVLWIKSLCFVLSSRWRAGLLPPITSMTTTLNFLPSGLPLIGASAIGNTLSNSTARFVEFHEPI